MHVQLALVKGSRPQRFLVRHDEAVVGRQKGCDLRIPSSEVSRRHCIVRVEKDIVTVEDLGSANGTYVNEDRVQGRRIVRPGDQIRLGSIVFIAEYHLSQEAMERLAQIDDEMDVELVSPARALSAEELQDDVEVVEDDPSLPPAAKAFVEAERKKEEESKPIAVGSSDALEAAKQPALTPRPKRNAPPPEEDQEPLPEPTGEGEALTEGWKMPQGGNLGALLEGIAEGEKEAKDKEKAADE